MPHFLFNSSIICAADAKKNMQITNYTFSLLNRFINDLLLFWIVWYPSPLSLMLEVEQTELVSFVSKFLSSPDSWLVPPCYRTHASLSTECDCEYWLIWLHKNTCLCWVLAHSSLSTLRDGLVNGTCLQVAIKRSKKDKPHCFESFLSHKTLVSC